MGEKLALVLLPRFEKRLFLDEAVAAGTSA